MNASPASKAMLTQGSVMDHLVRMTIPMIWGILAIVTIQLTDIYYISLLGDRALAAISFTFPVTMLVFHVLMAVGIATSSILARRIGADDKDGAQRITAHALILSACVAMVIAGGFVPFLDPLFRMLGTPDDMLPMVRDYMLPWLLGSVFISVPFVANAAIRATGDALTPALIMIGAAVINALLNPVLIFGLFGFPRLEIAGAAMVSVLANALAMAAGVGVLLARRHIVLFSRSILDGFGISARRLLVIAAPIALAQLVMPMTSAFVTALLAHESTEAVAAYGIVQRLEAFAFVVIMALAIGMGPIIGQNWGKGLYNRVETTLDYAIRFAVWWSAGIAVLFALGGPVLAGLFTDDAQIIEITVLYLVLVPASLVIGNLAGGWSSFYNAIGQSYWSFAILVLRGFVLTIPLTWAGYQLGGVIGIFVGMGLATLAAGAITHGVSIRYFHKLIARSASAH